ncbi:hypothetical protein CVT24_003222 [Panaeolus cyanescens]|uniref:WD repeat-containing protein JIP5 n=1 Tax=Panaeolus cyanescens TaxID=181874 RepID=A0A409VFV3_9AGAR|nr:hypothetical protein CVT24_003222 [Panaeolus cyanescens]
MPEIPVGAQIFDVVFHPTFATVYTGLLTGHVKAFAYDDQGAHKPVFSVRPAKSSCRGLSLNQDGSQLYAVGKGKSLSTIDTLTEKMNIRTGAHDSTINRVKHLMPWLVSTGDDDGVIKLWDPRQRDNVKEYTQHFDYITDFLWLDDKKQLVATSGDGTLSVMDVRSKKSEPVAQSEDQEDELLSIAAFKGGWGDCVDRIPGHPLSIDAICNVPGDIPGIDSSSTILTGSSDGLLRAVQILPTKLLGVVADHGEWPIERISVGSGSRQLSIETDDSDGSPSNISKKRLNDETLSPSSRKWWVGSVGHDETLRMTDLEGFFRDNEHAEGQTGAIGLENVDGDSDQDEGEDNEGDADDKMDAVDVEGGNSASEDEDGDGDEDDEDEGKSSTPPPITKKRRAEPQPIVPKKKKKGGHAPEIDRAFFDDL